MNNKDKWSQLSIKQRADLIKLYVESGIKSLDEIRKDYNGVPYKDFSSSNYDYFNAHPSNAPTEEGGHWSSRNPKTGQLLKRKDHPTFDLMIEGEKQVGYDVIKGLDGNLYSIPSNTNNYVEDYNSFGNGGDTSWEDVDKFVEKAEPWVSGASLALLGATAVQPELGVVTAPAMAVVNSAGVLFDGYQAVRDFQNRNYGSGALNSVEAIAGAFGAKAASKLAHTAAGKAIGKFKEQLIEDKFRASGDKIARLMRKGLTYEKAAERVLQNVVNYADNSSKVRDVSNGIREAYNKRFNTVETVIDTTFDTIDVGKGIVSRFKDEPPIEIYKNGGKLNIFADGGPTEEGGYSDKSKWYREVRHSKLDPAGGLGLDQLFYLSNHSKGDEDQYWRAYLGLESHLPKMNPTSKTEWDDKIEAEKIANGELPSDFYGTTNNMDLYIQAMADTTTTGKIVRNYDEFKKLNPRLSPKKEIEAMYRSGKAMMDNPNKWTQVGEVKGSAQLDIERKLNNGEEYPLGMLASFGAKWIPEENTVHIHDTYDFPWYSRILGRIPERPKEMKIRGKVKYNPKKQAKLFNADNFNLIFPK